MLSLWFSDRDIECSQYSSHAHAMIVVFSLQTPQKRLMIDVGTPWGRSVNAVKTNPGEPIFGHVSPAVIWLNLAMMSIVCFIVPYFCTYIFTKPLADTLSALSNFFKANST